MKNKQICSVLAVLTMIVLCSCCKNDGPTTDYIDIENIEISNTEAGCLLSFDYIESVLRATVSSDINGQVYKNEVGQIDDRIGVILSSNVTTAEKLSITLYNSYNGATSEYEECLVAESVFEVPGMPDDNRSAYSSDTLKVRDDSYFEEGGLFNFTIDLPNGVDLGPQEQSRICFYDSRGTLLTTTSLYFVTFGVPTNVIIKGLSIGDSICVVADVGGNLYTSANIILTEY